MNFSLDSLVRHGVLLICLGVSLAGSAYGIDPNWTMSQYIRDQWGIEQGLPRGQVYAITQTSDGYLWIGADAGLIRFDGLKFQLIRDDTGIFGITAVLGLTSDVSGNLWVRLERPEALVRYAGGVFNNPASKLFSPFSSITALSRTWQGDLLASQATVGAITFRRNKFEMLGDISNLPRSPILSIAQTTDGDIWMGTRDAGLFRVSGKQSSVIMQGIPDPKVNCLLPDGKHDLWVGTDNGIARWTGKEFSVPNIPALSNHFQALSMIRDRDANVWIGASSHGLLRMNSQGLSFLDADDGHPATGVTAVFEDREGNIWTGGANSIQRLRDSAFVTYSTSEGMPSSRNGPVYVDSQNRTWFAPLEGGLFWLDKGKVQRFDGAGIGNDVVYSIEGEPNGLWVGRQRGGLTYLHFAGDSTTVKAFTSADGLAQNSVYSVNRSSNGAVWAGTLSGGVSKFKDGIFTTYTTANGLASNTVLAMAESSDGTTWFGTPNGLSAFSKDSWHTYGVRDGLPSNNVNCVFQDSGGVLWIGTTAGLVLFRNGRVERLVGAPSSLREQILGIAEDHQGAIWISTSTEVLRVKREKLLKSPMVEADVRAYGATDGLRSTEGVRRHRSVVADSLGRIWFSLDHGLAVVDPSRMRNSLMPVIAHIQTISADGRPVDLRGPIRVSPGWRRIVFSYTGLGLSVPERVRFRYFLNGYDSHWSDPEPLRETAYTNLSPGPYRFRVIASSNDGDWTSPESAIDFQIEPAFWQTFWFRLALFAAFALALAAAYRMRLRQLTAQLNMRFEERIAERSVIAQDLHDTLLQGLLSASIQLHVASKEVSPESPAMPRLNRVLELMGQVIQEGRNAVRGLRSSSLNSLDLAQALSRIHEEVGAASDIGFRVIVNGQARTLHPVLRDETYRIGREALVNAFRHSNATSIEAQIDYSAKELLILVNDNGCGIDPHVLQSGRDGHWGLRGMRERAERIGGLLQLRSGPSSGTEVRLSVPGHVAFLKHPSKRRWGLPFFSIRPRSGSANGGRDPETDK